MENEVTNLGGKVAPRIAKVVSDAITHTTQQLTEHKSSFIQKQLADFTNHVSREVKELFDQVFIRIAEHPDLPDELRPAFTNLAYSEGQAFGWVGGSIAGTAMSASLFDFINNMLAPVVHALIASQPNSFLSPDQVAAARARGFDYIGEPRGIGYDALGAGINPARLEIMEKLASSYPSVNQVQDMVNRELMDEKTGRDTLHKLGYGANDRDLLVQARRMYLSPADLATMRNRDVVSQAEGRDGAAKWGMTREDFDKLEEIYGEPLGVQALGEAYRRGFIDRERFLRGVIQGPLRKEWFDVAEALQYARMSTVDAADAVNQGHLDLEQARAIAQANGMIPEDFQTLIEIAGAPPGIDFITEALNRGLIDAQTFTAAFLESRIKNKYVDLLLQMRYRLIPQETVRLLYRNGVYPFDQALDTLLKHGFTDSDAQALLALENTRQDDTTKELTRSQIVDMYQVRAVDLGTALNLLLSLGYSSANAQAMIELADVKRYNTFIASAVNRVKAAFLAGRMDVDEASAQLDALGLPVDQRDDYLTLWDIDRNTISKQLTPAQIRQAFKKNMIDQEAALARLVAQGYARDDAELYLELTA